VNCGRHAVWPVCRGAMGMVMLMVSAGALWIGGCVSGTGGGAAVTAPSAPAAPKSVLYAMNYLAPTATSDETLKDIKSSGFDTLVIFSIDGNAAGDLTFFGTPIYTGGRYVGPAGWPGRIQSLKRGATSIQRLEFCLAGPYGVYRTYMNAHGTGGATNWFQNWARLKEDTGADAINFNDENTWDAASLVQLGTMMDAMGYKVTLCPYNRPRVWQSVKAELGSKVDAVYLQCYDGGARNNVGTWNGYFDGLKVTPLFWTQHADGSGDTCQSAETKVRGWKSSAGVVSAGAWQYSDMRDFGGGSAAQFNAAIRAGLR
jgi:hypothetical protein